MRAFSKLKVNELASLPWIMALLFLLLPLPRYGFCEGVAGA